MKSGGFRGHFTIEDCLCVEFDIANPGSDHHLVGRRFSSERGPDQNRTPEARRSYNGIPTQSRIKTRRLGDAPSVRTRRASEPV